MSKEVLTVLLLLLGMGLAHLIHQGIFDEDVAFASLMILLLASVIMLCSLLRFV